MSRSDGSTADYYVLPEGATQLQDLISHRNMNAQIGEIFRAGYRYGMASHSDMLRDAKKIRFYAQAEVERLEKLSAVVEETSHIPSHASIAAADHPYNQPSHIISDIPALVLDGSGVLIWSKAPQWANWLATDVEGAHWYEEEPEMGERGNCWRYPMHSEYESLHEYTSEVAKYPRPTSTTK
jgi:hypothetical protein